MAAEPDFRAVRNGLDRATLVDLFEWTEEAFARRMEGSAIRRIGYAKWLSNIAIALGNCRRTGTDAASVARATAALQARLDDARPIVREAVVWALGHD